MEPEHPRTDTVDPSRSPTGTPTEDSRVPLPEPRGFRGRRVVVACIIGAVLAYVVACIVLVRDGLTDRPGRADVAIVPGSKVERSGVPSTRLAARLDRALELYKAGDCRRILVSGGYGKEGYDEARVMEAYLVDRGVSATAVIIDSEGVDTWATARNTARLLGETTDTKCVVVSQYFHIPRTRLALQRFGVSADYSAHARIYLLRDLYSIPREVAGMVWYWLRPGGGTDNTD